MQGKWEGVGPSLVGLAGWEAGLVLQLVAGEGQDVICTLKGSLAACGELSETMQGQVLSTMPGAWQVGDLLAHFN